MKKISIHLLALSITVGLIPVVCSAQSGPSSSQNSGSAKHRLGKSSSGQGEEEIAASKLIGAGLKGENGDDLGEVRDLVLNPQTGKIEFVILGIDAGGGTEALLPVPWQAVKFQPKKSLFVSLDKNKVKSGPTLTGQQWEQLAQPDSDYTLRIYRFYGFPPPPATGGTGEGEGGAESGSSQQQGSQQPKGL